MLRSPRCPQGDGAVENPSSVTVHGELVHNEVVLEDLAARGFRTVSESNREAIPDTPNVLITAHGVSDRERTRLAAAGKRLIDTTCPLVRRAHDAAIKLRDEGAMSSSSASAGMLRFAG